MSGFYGADTDQLRDHSALLVQRATAIGELRDLLQPVVMDESAWRGPDADAFRERWSSSTSPLFDQAGELISRRGTDLEQHAEEQDEASGAGGEGGGGAGGDGGKGDEPFSPLGFLKDLVSKGQGVYKGIKSLADYISRIPSAADEYADLARRGLEGLWKQSYLDELFKGGKGWQAGAEKLLGKLGIPTSIGNFEPLKHLNKLDDAAPWLKTAGRGIGKALPFLDVGMGIGRIATSDNWYDRSSGILQTAGGALLIAAPFTGPAAPIVGAVGAGLGLVSAGMDLGKYVYENVDWGAVGSTVSDAASNVADFATDTASTVSDAVGSAAETVSDGVSNAASAVSDGIGGLGDALGF